MAVLTDEKANAANTRTSTLALHGGEPVLKQSAPTAPRWGEPELRQLEEMLGQSSLFYWNGAQTKLLLERFKEQYPLEYAMPCSSGTAAIHIAVAAAGIGPGDEVITTAITDMGTLIGVLYQGGVPVFADLNPHTYNLDPQDVARKITPRTKAIIAVHLAGNPCEMDALKKLCDEHDLILIEDCAQAWGAQYRNAPVGTLGNIGCWSLNDFKHIGCGDGGITASSDERFGPLLQKFGDKAYARGEGARKPETLAPNYRISEPQSAIAAAQMLRMPEITRKRHELGTRLSELLQDVPGIQPHRVNDGDYCTFWFYMARVDPEVLSCDNAEFAKAVGAEGAACGAGYIGVPVYQYPMFQNHNFFAGRWPIKEMGLTDMDYTRVHCPQTEAILNTALQIPIKEAMDEEWIEGVAAAMKKVAEYYAK